VRLRGKSPARVLLGAQIATTASAALLTEAFRGTPAAMAALFGGAVAIAPTAWFGIKMQPRAGRSGPEEMVGAMYRAEVGKLLLTASLFWIGAMLFGDHFAALILTCAACLSMNWLVLAIARFD
jgi:F0F1-type ATP synthase assembly protein I